MKINISPNDSKTYQHAHSYADYLGISVYVFNRCLFESNNIFFYNLQNYIVFSLSEFQPIFSLSSPTLALASNIRTFLTYGLSPQVLFFLLRINTTYINLCHTHTLFAPYMVFVLEYQQNSKVTFISGTTITKFILRYHHQKKT